MKKTSIILLLILICFCGCNNTSNDHKNIKQITIDSDFIKDEFVKYLESKICDDGSFEYITNLDGSKELDDYNLLRHSLSYVSLLSAYKNDDLPSKKETIEKGIDFLIPSIIYKNEEEAFLMIYKDNEITLGSTSLAIVLMCDYQNKYDDDRYFEYAKKLSNGILSMQRLEGRFNHVFNSNFTFKEKERIIYYEGEAVLALCKIYDLTKDERYINAARKAIDYYILSGYEAYGDHWQEYAVNEYSKYVEENYILEYGLKNANTVLENISKSSEVYNTNLETLNNGLEILAKYKYSGDSIITREKLENAINNAKNDIINTYLSAKEKNKIEGFFAQKGYKSVRIDDIAHYILALCQ